MSILFHADQHQQHRLNVQDKEDLLLAVQIPIALTALALLFFLA